MTNKGGFLDRPPVQPLPQLVFKYDLRHAALGTVIGHNMRVQACEKCGLPGIHRRLVRCGDGRHRRIAHVLEFYLHGSEARCEYTDCCTEPTPVKPTAAANDNANDESP